MATFSNNDIAQAIYLSSKDKDASEQKVVFQNVTKFLFRRNLFSRSREILSSLRKIVNEDNGILEVNISSKHKIDNQVKNNLTHFLKKHHGDKKFVFIEKLDENLLGGFKIKVNDEVIDLTLQNKVYKLQKHLMTSYE